MRRLAATCILLSSVVSPAHAQTAEQTDYLTAGLGWFDLVDQDDESAQLSLEYRMKPFAYGLRPTLGAHLTTDWGRYVYAGLNWDLPVLRDEIYLIPSFMAGVYGEGDSKDLGGAIQFRSGIELAYQFQDAGRLGVAFNHISNASIYDKNPGAETLLVQYSLPIGSLFSY